MKNVMQKLSAFVVLTLASHTAVAQQTPVQNLSFNDEQFEACVVSEAQGRYAEEIQILSCESDTPVTDISGVEQLTNLQALSLSVTNLNSELNSLAPLAELESLQRLHLGFYSNDDTLFETLAPEDDNLRYLSIVGMPNLTNDFNLWVREHNNLSELQYVSLALSELPQPNYFDDLRWLRVSDNLNMNLNDVVASWGEYGLESLELDGSAEQHAVFEFDDWRLSGLSYLTVSRGTADSINGLVDAINTGNNNLIWLVINDFKTDWAGIERVSSGSPNLQELNLSSTDFDNYQLLTSFTSLTYLGLYNTEDNDAETLLTVMENNPGISEIYLGNGSNFFCDDKARINAEDTNNIIRFNSYSEACRTEQYEFRVTPSSDTATEIVDASNSSYPETVRADKSTSDPLSVSLTVAPIYEDDFVERSVRVTFDDGTTDYYQFRYEQEPKEPVKITDIEFVDPELARCARDMATSQFNVTDDEAIEYAHEITYMVCDKPAYEVTNLAGLEHFTNVQFIQMFGEGETLTNIEPLLELHFLVWLTLSDKNIGDQAFAVMSDYVGFARYWQNLNLDSNGLSDSTLFEHWFATPYTGSVYLSDNQYTTIPEFVMHSQFYSSIDISYNPIDSIADELIALDERSNVGTLTIGGFQLQDISRLRFPASLVSLGLVDMGLTNLDVIDLPEQLKYLALTDNPISDVSALFGNVQLDSLNLRSTNIDDISFLSEFPSLLTLYLDDSELTDLAPLANLSRENSLNLTVGYTKIEDYSPALDKDWLTINSEGNGHVACSEFEALEQSSTRVYWSVCRNEDGTITINDDYDSIFLAEESSEYGQLVRTDDGFSFIPNAGVEGWIEVTIVVTAPNGQVYEMTVWLYVEPGTTNAKAQGNGIPIVILVAGDKEEN